MSNRKFWDGVAKLYSASNMTTHSADFETGIINNISISSPLDGVASFGGGQRSYSDIAKYSGS